MNLVVINSDCLFGITKVKTHNYKKGSIHHKLDLLIGKIQSKYWAHNVRIQLRHVKAHSGTDKTRQWVNDWCDKAAKKHIGNFLNTL